MEGYLEMISVPAIAAAVFAIMSAIKYAVNNEKFNRFVPLLSALLGAACGIVCYFALPNIVPARNWVAAMVIGCASGLVATGTHQMVKQLGCNDKNADKPSEKPSEDANHDDKA